MQEIGWADRHCAASGGDRAVSCMDSVEARTCQHASDQPSKASVNSPSPKTFLHSPTHHLTFPPAYFPSPPPPPPRPPAAAPPRPPAAAAAAAAAPPRPPAAAAAAAPPRPPAAAAAAPPLSAADAEGDNGCGCSRTNAVGNSRSNGRDTCCCRGVQLPVWVLSLAALLACAAARHLLVQRQQLLQLRKDRDQWKGGYLRMKQALVFGRGGNVFLFT
ncbi:hypothetical protein CLOM_g21726 [Closterium sp. NIES-68]|nr:hypothetical protein CLOM_g21726 [Closterium sp. NIES-68]